MIVQTKKFGENWEVQMNSNKLAISNDLKKRLKEMKVELGVPISRDGLGKLYGGCGGTCEATCSYYCEWLCQNCCDFHGNAGGKQFCTLMP